MPSTAPDFTEVIWQAIADLPRPIGLLGLGAEGLGTLAFLKAQGVTSLLGFDQAYTDQGHPPPAAGEADLSDLRVFGGPQYAQELTSCGTIFRSPGVRPDLPELVAAREAGAWVTSATRLFLKLAPGRIVGVTGTAGKGTTVTLIGEALRAAQQPYFLGGNLGPNPLSFLGNLTADHVSVLELSSFQLMDVDANWPDIAVLLRIESDHLDWHRDAFEYLTAKSKLIAPEDPEWHNKITEDQTVICNLDSLTNLAIAVGHLSKIMIGDGWLPPKKNSNSSKHFRKYRQVSVNHQVLDGIGCVPSNQPREPEQTEQTEQPGAPGGPRVPARLERFTRLSPQGIPVLERIALPGRFNLENAAAALLVCDELGLPPEVASRAIAQFPGLPHRLERVGTVAGVLCVNDSYATRPQATLGALEAVGSLPGLADLDPAESGPADPNTADPNTAASGPASHTAASPEAGAVPPLAVILGGSEKRADFTALMQALSEQPNVRRVLWIGDTAARMEAALDQVAAQAGQAPPPAEHHASLEAAFEAGLQVLAGGPGILLMSPACASFGLFDNYKQRGECFRQLVAQAQAKAHRST